MKESNLSRLVHAFIVSRVGYVTSSLALKNVQKEKLNCLIRKALKQAFGIPISALNKRLESMGIDNALDEIIEAQQTAQLQRLTCSPTGRLILHKLRITYATQQGNKTMIPINQRARIYISPLPCNMHPEHNAERRRARAQALHKRFEHSEHGVYVDAAEYHDLAATTVAVVDRKADVIAFGSVLTAHSEVGKEVAIALALASTPAKL